MSEKFEFLYPRSRYGGEFQPQNLIFNANLQEFAHRVMIISGLETNGKISSEESYRQVKSLWKELKRSRKAMSLGQSSSRGDDRSTELP